MPGTSVWWVTGSASPLALAEAITRRPRGPSTAEQRDVIEATVQRQESLSDWVAARGTSYEAGRRLRGRGIAALRRCIADRKRNSDA